MNKNLLIIIGVVLFGLACGVIGRLTAPKKVITVEIRPDVDSIKGVILRGKMDSTTYADLLRRYRRLVENQHGVPIPDTAFILPETPIFTSSFTLDTLLEMNVTAIAGEDTMKIPSQVKASLGVTYLGEALNAFAIDNLSVYVPPYSVPVKRIDPAVNISGRGFGFKVMAGVSGGSPGMGAGFDIGPIEIGSMYHINREFTYLASWRFSLF